MFSTISRKIKQGTYVEPEINMAKRARLDNVSIQITAAERSAIEKDLANPEKEISEMDQQLQEAEMEQLERNESDADKLAFLADLDDMFDRLENDEEITDEGHPILVSIFFTFNELFSKYDIV